MKRRNASRRAVCLLAAGALAASLLAGSARAAPGDVTLSMVVPAPGINPTGSATPFNFTIVNGTLFFAASDGVNGNELWKTDGTPAGTVMVEDAIPGGGINPGGAGSSPGSLTNVNGTLFFSATDGVNGVELWRSDGTPGGTAMIEVYGGGIRPGSSASTPVELTNFNGTLLFAATDGVNGFELWRSDGTSAGTVMLENTVPGGGINPGANSSSPGNLIDLNGTLFFAANDGTNGRELWKSNGVPAGTVMVEDAIPGDGIDISGNSDPDDLTNLGGTLFFSAEESANGRELWKSDGTPSGTTVVEDAVPGGGINPSFADSSPTGLSNVGGTLYFGADDGTNGTEPWKSDGTPAGTVMIEDAVPGGGLGPGNLPAVPGTFTGVGNQVFFGADNTNGNGLELWKTDGTPAGTVMVEDASPGSGINPGVASASVSSLNEFNGILFFRANDGTNGIELWRSDGTPTGTFMLEDAVPGGGIAPGATASSPLGFTIFNGALHFSASDGTNGTELWKATMEGAAPPTTPPSNPVTTSATGQRAAALKKCKKKKSSKARKKCRARALKLPI